MKTIEEKFKESLAKGPDQLSLKIKFHMSKISVNQRSRPHRFVERGKSNVLGKTSTYAREALTLGAVPDNITDWLKENN